MSFYQGKSYAKEGDLDLVYSKYLEARQAVMKAMAGESMREAARRLFPLPCDRWADCCARVLWQRAVAACCCMVGVASCLLRSGRGR